MRSQARAHLKQHASARRSLAQQALLPLLPCCYAPDVLHLVRFLTRCELASRTSDRPSAFDRDAADRLACAASPPDSCAALLATGAAPPFAICSLCESSALGAFAFAGGPLLAAPCPSPFPTAAAAPSKDGAGCEGRARGGNGARSSAVACAPASVGGGAGAAFGE